MYFLTEFVKIGQAGWGWAAFDRNGIRHVFLSNATNTKKLKTNFHD